MHPLRIAMLVRQWAAVEGALRDSIKQRTGSIDSGLKALTAAAATAVVAKKGTQLLKQSLAARKKGILILSTDSSSEWLGYASEQRAVKRPCPCLVSNIFNRPCPCLVSGISFRVTLHCQILLAETQLLDRSLAMNAFSSPQHTAAVSCQLQTCASSIMTGRFLHMLLPIHDPCLSLLFPTRIFLGQNGRAPGVWTGWRGVLTQCW